MRTQTMITECAFCAEPVERAISGRRSGAPAQIVCVTCLSGLTADLRVDGCDFCDHPSGQAARSARTGATLCADCLAFARHVLAEEDAADSDGQEGRLDSQRLWNDLTPAPRPEVDAKAPATAHADLALAFLEMGRYDDAREQVAKALELDPLHPVALRVIEKLPAPPRMA